jgi:uncharacterized protein (TIGR02246 family)
MLQDAFNRSDLDAFIALYEDDATLVVPPDGEVVHGREAIRAALAAHLALPTRMTSVVRKKLQADGLALTRARWELTAVADDGSRTNLSGRGAIVSRRRPDGTWGIVLDDPLSSE